MILKIYGLHFCLKKIEWNILLKRAKRVHKIYFCLPFFFFYWIFLFSCLWNFCEMTFYLITLQSVESKLNLFVSRSDDRGLFEWGRDKMFHWSHLLWIPTHKISIIFNTASSLWESPVCKPRSSIGVVWKEAVWRWTSFTEQIFMYETLLPSGWVPPVHLPWSGRELLQLLKCYN